MYELNGIFNERKKSLNLSRVSILLYLGNLLLTFLCSTFSSLEIFSKNI